jgi:hypothetical protein
MMQDRRPKFALMQLLDVILVLDFHGESGLGQLPGFF